MDAKHNVEFVKRCVRLRNYSSSPGWLGFLSAPPTLPMYKLVAMCLQITREVCGQLQCVSAKTIYGTALEDAETWYSRNSKRVLWHRNRMIDSGILRVIPDFDESIFDDDNFCPEFHFSNNVLFDVAKSAMWVGIERGTKYGPLFFVNSEKGVLLYPHDDAGVGIIFDVENPYAESYAREKVEFLKREFADTFAFLRGWEKRA